MDRVEAITTALHKVEILPRENPIKHFEDLGCPHRLIVAAQSGHQTAVIELCTVQGRYRSRVRQPRAPTWRRGLSSAQPIPAPEGSLPYLATPMESRQVHPATVAYPSHCRWHSSRSILPSRTTNPSPHLKAGIERCSNYPRLEGSLL